MKRRLLLGAFGDPGHAFPMLALGRALAARGHEVTLQTWRRWHDAVEAEGMRFAASVGLTVADLWSEAAAQAA